MDIQLSKRVRVLVANKFFFRKGGSEAVFFQERDYLQRAGADVYEFSMKDDRNLPSEYERYFVDTVDYNTSKGVLRSLRAAVRLIYSREAAGRIGALADHFRPDLAHLHNIYHQITPSIIPALKRRGIPVVMTLHDYKLACPIYTMLCHGTCCHACASGAFWHASTRRCQRGSIGQSLVVSAEAYWHWLRRTYDGVDIFVAPSNFLGEVMGRHRLPPEKIRILRNGIDAGATVPGHMDLGYGLYLGRISPEKGIRTLLAAHAGGCTEIPLKVVGTGPLEQSLKDEFPRAEFVGYKSGEELRSLVADASFVVIPSEWYENCSMAVLEAMALGKPVIGARIGGIPEQVEDGVTGVLFTPGDADDLAGCMIELWRDSGMRRAMGAAARAKLEREYSLDQHCEGLLNIYKELLL